MTRANDKEVLAPQERALGEVVDGFLYSEQHRYNDVLLIRRPNLVRQVKEQDRFREAAREYVAFIAGEKHGDRFSDLWGLRDHATHRETRIYGVIPPRAVRVRTTLPVAWGLTEDCGRQGVITDLSITGCYVETKENREGLQRDQRIFILWRTYLGNYYLRGEVKFSVSGVGMGVSFVELAAQYQKMLRQLVDDHLTAPHR